VEISGAGGGVGGGADDCVGIEVIFYNIEFIDYK
jgi:hypothetical protein